MDGFLLSIGVKKEDIESCIINEKGIFIPTYDSEGNITITAQENYDECIKQIDNCTGPTVEEQLLATQKMVLSLQEQIIDML